MSFGEYIPTFLLGMYLTVKLLNHRGYNARHYSIVQNHFPKWIFLQQCRRVLIDPLSLQHWYISIFLLIFIILLGIVQYCIVLLIYIFHMTHEVDNFLFMFIDILSDEVSMSFAYLSIGLALFFLIDFKEFFTYSKCEFVLRKCRHVNTFLIHF